MKILDVSEDKHRKKWNSVVQHPLQSWEWGEFRKKTGITTVRYGIFDGETLMDGLQITIHPIPYTPWAIGYCPKSRELTPSHRQILDLVARKYNCISIKCEPQVEARDEHIPLRHQGFKKGRSLFTTYNFVLDVRPSEEELLKNMKQKTRYNIKVATKRGVTVQLDDSKEAFARYLELTRETTERQGFYAHGGTYHRSMWEVLHTAGIAHLLTATYQNKIITTWILFRFGDTLYYPYGASTREHRDVMANNLVMWEAIKLAKQWKLTTLDMWGALGPDPDTHDPWYGFHTFKAGYGARHVTYIGTWDYVARPLLYLVFRIIENIRWWILRQLK